MMWWGERRLTAELRDSIRVKWVKGKADMWDRTCSIALEVAASLIKQRAKEPREGYQLPTFCTPDKVTNKQQCQKKYVNGGVWTHNNHIKLVSQHNALDHWANGT